MRLLSLSSGSKGNCVIIATDSTAIIVDAGVCARSVDQGLRKLGHKNSRPSVLITHSHHDHIGKLPYVSKKFTPDVYCHIDCFNSVSNHLSGGKIVLYESDFYIGDITVSPFCLSHDTPCFGYSFYHMGKKISLLTDLGVIDDDVLSAIESSDLLFIEANHDEEMLMNNPAYPVKLKRRILSQRGHLSNIDCALGISKVANGRLKQVILGHLSAENNYPSLAINVVMGVLKDAGVEGISVSAALQNTVCGIYEVV